MQLSEVQTPASVPEAPLICRSTKLPAGMETEPIAVQVPPEGPQDSGVAAIVVEELPRRSVTVMLPLWWDWTSSSVAVQPLGIQARMASLSVVAALGELSA